MNRYPLFGLGLLVVVASLAFTEVFANSNDEWLDIDMEFRSTNDKYLTITCEKDSDMSFDMLMTVINYNTKDRLSVIHSTSDIISETITLDDSMIQVFCEYVHSDGDKAGYAIMRTFVP